MDTIRTFHNKYETGEHVPPRGSGDVIIFHAWSGNVRPWNAMAYRDGKLLGGTGFAKTADRAIAAARKFFK